jgi:hypothetical protein
MSIKSLTVFGTETNSLNFHGELIFENDGDFCINYIGKNLVENSESEELILYGKLDNKTKFTAICLAQSKKSIVNKNKRNNILIKKLFLGGFLEDVEKLKISNIYIRTSYLEHWFYDFPFDSENFKIDANELDIKDKIEYSENFTLSFEHEYNTNIENNKKFIFDSSYYIKIESNEMLSLSEMEEERKKILVLFKFLLPSKDVYSEDVFFFFNGEKIKIYEKQFYYRNENKNKVSRYDYLVNYNEDTSKDLIKNWFKFYEKYKIVSGYLFTTLDDKIIKVSESKFLLYMQWIEGFCREKFSCSLDDEISFNSLVENLKAPFEENSDEYKWIEEQTKYGLKQNFLKQIKDLMQELKSNKYIQINKNHKNKVSKKIKDLRDELTHLEIDRKNYENMEIVYINHFIKGIIVYSIINELKIPISQLNNLQLIQLFRDYDVAISHLIQKGL